MLEYISDSENDSGGEINPETVSLTRMERVLSTFPMEDQIAITNSLQQSGYLIRHSQDNHVEDEGGNENLNHVNEEDENSTTRDDLDAASRVYNIDELFSDITYASQEIDETPKSQPQQQQIQVNAVRISQQSRPFFEPQPLSHGNASEEEEAENANHLRAYLGSKQSVYNRRGLRNRSFANAHPYLADSSHWMGLASISVLNDLYKENHDVELIVKILNQKYMKNKQKYPKDDKFKSKSFYAFLGKSRNSGSYNADIDDSNQEQNHQLQQTQDGESEQYSQPQDYYSEDENYESQRDSLGLLQGMNYDADIFNFPEDNYLGVSPRYEQDQYLENTTPDNDFQNNTLDNESQNEEGDDDDNDDEGKGEGEESEDEDETLVRVGGVY